MHDIGMPGHRVYLEDKMLFTVLMDFFVDSYYFAATFLSPSLH